LTDTLANSVISDRDIASMLAIDVDEVKLNSATMGLVERSADLLNKMRTEQGFSQRELGNLLGVSEGRISQYESGLLRHCLNLKTLAKAAHILGYQIALDCTPVQIDQEMSPKVVEDSSLEVFEEFAAAAVEEQKPYKHAAISKLEQSSE